MLGAELGRSGKSWADDAANDVLQTGTRVFNDERASVGNVAAGGCRESTIRSKAADAVRAIDKCYLITSKGHDRRDMPPHLDFSGA